MEQWLGGNKADKGTEIRGINPKLVKTENDVRKRGTQTPIIVSRSMIVSGSDYEENRGKGVKSGGGRVKELMGKFQKVERVEIKKVKDDGRRRKEVEWDAVRHKEKEKKTREILEKKKEAESEMGIPSLRAKRRHPESGEGGPSKILKLGETMPFLKMKEIGGRGELKMEEKKGLKMKPGILASYCEKEDANKKLIHSGENQTKTWGRIFDSNFKDCGTAGMESLQTKDGTTGNNLDGS